MDINQQSAIDTQPLDEGSGLTLSPSKGQQSA
jgi:hypothetical protein